MHFTPHISGKQQNQRNSKNNLSSSIPLLGGDEGESLYLSTYRTVKREIQMQTIPQSQPNNQNYTSRKINTQVKNKQKQTSPKSSSNLFSEERIPVINESGRKKACQWDVDGVKQENKMDNQLKQMMLKYGKSQQEDRQNPKISYDEFKQLIGDIWSYLEQPSLSASQIQFIVQFTKCRSKQQHDSKQQEQISLQQLKKLL